MKLSERISQQLTGEQIMKKNVKLILAMLMMLVLSVSAFAVSATTNQTWSFDNDTNPAAPNAGYVNVLGTPEAEATVGFFGSGWFDTLGGFGTTQGFWDIGAEDGSIVVTVPFSTSIILGSETIQLEYIYFKDISDKPVVAIGNATEGSWDESLVLHVSTGGDWYKHSSTWSLDSNLTSPYLTISMVGFEMGSYIDKVSVNTSAELAPVPEPATLLGLASFIPGAFIAFRKRK